MCRYFSNFLESPSEVSWGRSCLVKRGKQSERSAKVSLHCNILHSKIRWLRISGKSPMDVRMPPLKTKILLESNTLRSRIFLRRLAVAYLLKSPFLWKIVCSPIIIHTGVTWTPFNYNPSPKRCSRFRSASIIRGLSRGITCLTLLVSTSRLVKF